MCATEPKEASGSTWRQEEDFDRQVALDVVSSHNLLSGAGSSRLRFLHLHSR